MNSALSTFDWYDASTGGTKVATGTNTFSTPAISATTTYYVEDTRTFTYTNASTYTAAGGTGLTAQSVWSSGTPIGMTFTVIKPLTIKTVTVNFAGSGTLPTTISIAGPGGPYTKAVTVNLGGTTVVTLNISLGAGTYTMSYSSGYSNAIVYSGATFTKGVTGLIDFNNVTGSGYISTSNFFDWVIDAPTSCARIPVVAQLTAACPLPVTLLSFNGKKTGADVDLYWSTSMERNSKQFEIERSVDGINFTPIAKVDAAGNSNKIVNYTITDLAVQSSGVVYYRLKHEDFDGSFEYSKIISVDFSKDELVTMQLYPNPVEQGGELNLNALSSIKGKIQVVIYDLTSKQVFNGSYEIVKGFNKVPLSTHNMPKGMYILNVSVEGQASQSLKLMLD